MVAALLQTLPLEGQVPASLPAVALVLLVARAACFPIMHELDAFAEPDSLAIVFQPAQ